MNKEFIPYELSAQLVEMGYDEPSEISIHYGVGDGHIAILYQQAFRWFRESGLLNSHIEYIGASNQYQWHIKHYWETFDTYEEAELACLKKLIEMVKGKEVSTQCNTFN